jgi:3'-5' exoribonuclease
MTEDGHIFVRDLEPGPVHAIYAVQEARALKTRNGKPYLALTLKDNSASIKAKRWDVTDPEVTLAKPGAYIEFKGEVELYRNTPQIIIADMREASPEDVFVPAFEHVLPFDPDDLLAEVRAMLMDMQDPDLVRVAEAYLDDEEFMARFYEHPAAREMHHPYPFGLLEHVHSAMRLGQSIAAHYEWVDADMVLLGIFLHDSGKVVELQGGEMTAYSIEGEMLGHITIGINLLDRKLQQLGDIPHAKGVHLKHIILSHHGVQEWGSPKPPMTGEALIVHTIEMMDAKMNAFMREREELPETEDETGGVRWSRLLKRRILTAPKQPPPADDPE